MHKKKIKIDANVTFGPMNLADNCCGTNIQINMYKYIKW